MRTICPSPPPWPAIVELELQHHRRQIQTTNPTIARPAWSSHYPTTSSGPSLPDHERPTNSRRPPRVHPTTLPDHNTRPPLLDHHYPPPLTGSYPTGTVRLAPAEEGVHPPRIPSGLLPRGGFAGSPENRAERYACREKSSDVLHPQPLFD